MAKPVAVPGGQLQAGGDEGERRRRGQLVVAERGQPAGYVAVGSTEDVAAELMQEQLPEPLGVVGGDGVGDCALGVAVVLVPAARREVELPLAPGLEPAQLAQQGSGQKRVVAVPLVRAVERLYQQVGPRQLGQRPG